MKGASMRIITDSGSMMPIDKAKQLNVTLIPLQVEVSGQNYRDYFDLSSDDFIAKIQTAVPNSSQPAIGDVMAAFDQPEEALYIAMTSGLSSTYVSAAALQQNPEYSHVSIFNSKTLAGTQQYLVEVAARLAASHPLSDVKARLEHCLSECQSYLIPVDFEFLKRNGRLSSMAALMSGFLKLKPIVFHKPGMEKLEKFAVSRTWQQAMDAIIDHMVSQQVSIQHKIYVSHAQNLAVAQQFIQRIQNRIASIEIELLPLTPVMITQGGPGCVAVQYILKDDRP
jgi:DegV family protein with EDD domain